MDNNSFFIFLTLASFALAGSFFKLPGLDKVFLRFYKRNGSYEDKSLKDINSLIPELNPNEMLVMYVHGHVESVETDSVMRMTSTFLNYTNVNVVALDYREVANSFYPLSVNQSEGVGKMVAKALDGMIEAGWNREHIYIVGHSLGAQIGGYIGRNMKFRLPRITGLDPAGPLFYSENAYLSSSDAEYVDIIHTDAGVYGLAITSGSADFFPNFGHKIQPGCQVVKDILTNNGLCSHHRSWTFFMESIRNRDAFIGVKCPNDIMYALGLCNSNEKAIMGYATQSSTKGSFYLRTNTKEPFGLGLEGVIYNSTSLRTTVSEYVRSIIP